MTVTYVYIFFCFRFIELPCTPNERVNTYYEKINTTEIQE